MGSLTDDMSRLVGEINVMRGARADLMAVLAHGVEELSHSTSSMLAGFSKAHRQMARKAKAERLAFINGLEKKILKMRKEFSSDLAGAHRAWHGKRPKI